MGPPRTKIHIYDQHNNKKKIISKIYNMENKAAHLREPETQTFSFEEAKIILFMVRTVRSI